MMRDKTGIVCVLAALAAAACSFGGGSGSSNPKPDAGNGAVCGDNVCAATEVNNCPQDCGNGGNGNNTQAVCGNGQCETSKGESATSCPSDCGGGSGAAVCGNGVCETGETTSCPSDCGGGGSGGNLNCSDPTTLLACFTCLSGGGCTGVDMNSCNACLGGSGSSTCNNNGVCDPGETSAACPLDNCP